MLFKFWKWRVEVKARHMDADKKIAFLAQELVKAILADGRSVTGSNDNIGYMQIWLHDNGSNTIENATKNWAIPFKVDINWQKESPRANES